MTIDWTNRNASVSKWFRVKDAIFLPRWGRLADDSDYLDDNAKEALVDIFERLDTIYIDILKVKPIIHVAFRSPKYNNLLGGAVGSAHIARTIRNDQIVKHIAAIDFSVNLYPEKSIEENCDLARELLLPHIEALDLRMEDNPSSNWIHIDTKPIINNGNRFFKP